MKIIIISCSSIRKEHLEIIEEDICFTLKTFSS